VSGVRPLQWTISEYKPGVLILDVSSPLGTRDQLPLLIRNPDDLHTYIHKRKHFSVATVVFVIFSLVCRMKQRATYLPTKHLEASTIEFGQLGIILHLPSHGLAHGLASSYVVWQFTRLNRATTYAHQLVQTRR
jgi:hypothetical protein